MRISVDKSDPGYRPDARLFTAYLNGEKLEHCLTADDEAGEAVINYKDESGNFAHDGVTLLRRTLFGQIEIRKRD
ncbi:hypothetical protein A1351_23305 [Methylosinus sp. R-45379]|uniref:hypothetical protein n=1 Tax=Methylosinus sp. R-45379 TaxID=980563 RepID=UPI0007C904B6|nr:hypothetical protein [Methylosinus sp. R-45379]OAI29767.1 hypothetical protein A1351_23305 [Methylosinus sp. R-45379]